MEMNNIIYKVLLYVSVVGLGLGLIVHVGAYCGYVFLPSHPWYLIGNVTAVITFVLSIWRRIGTMKQWMKNGPALIRHVFLILTAYAVALVWLELLIKVTPDAGMQYASRPVLAVLLRMTVNEYQLYRARTFSVILIYVFFITAVQAMMILRDGERTDPPT